MCDFPREDPRDAASEACGALVGLMVLVSEKQGTVDAQDLSSMLRLITDRLVPACEAMQNFVPRV